MARRRRGPTPSRVLTGLALALTLAACGDGELVTPIGDPEGYAPPPDPSSVRLGDGTTLHAGDDGSMPVRVRWTTQLSAPENFYVVGDLVYVSDECLVVLSVDRGDRQWEACKPDGNGIFTDGGDEIGPAGPGRVRLWTWFNDDLLIDTTTHAVVRRRPGGGHRPRGFRPFPAGLDHTWDISFDGTATDDDGRTAWSITTEEPMFGPLGMRRTPTGGILVTSSGLMVALDYDRSAAD